MNKTRKTYRFVLPAVMLVTILAGQLIDARAAENEWVEAIKITGIAGRGNEVVTKTFELPHDAKVKIKWELTPTGNAPLFRATLGSWQENVRKYVNSGVIVRAGSATSNEQAGKLPAGKHRVMFTMKRMKYTFSIHYQR